MVHGIKQILIPPVFEDEDKTHRSRLLHIISLIIFAIFILTSAVGLFIFNSPATGLRFSGLTALVLMGVIVLIRFKRVQIASQLFVFGFWALDTALIYGTGGLRSSFTPGYVVLAVLAGLLLTKRSAITLWGLMTAAGLGMLYVDGNGLQLEPFLNINIFSRWLYLTSNVAMAAALVHFTNRRIKKTMARAGLGKGRLAEADREVRKRITERKHAQEEFRQLKEFNENIVQSVAETIIIEDENGILTFANPRIEKLLGYSPSDLIGKHWTTIVPEESAEKVRKETIKRPDGIESQYEIILQKLDGTEIPVIASARPLFTEGKFKGVLSAFTEITHLKRVENELRETHQQLNTTLNALPDLLFEIDLDGKILSFHAPDPALLIPSPDHFLGKAIKNVLPEEPAKAIMAAIDDTVSQGVHVGTVFSLGTPQGKHWFELSMAAKGDPKIPGNTIVTLARDITERRTTEYALRESEEKYRSLVENINIGVYRSSDGVDGKFIHANTAIVEIFGYESVEEVLGVPVIDVCETKEELERFVNEVMDQGSAKNREIRLVKKDGSPFWASCTASAQFTSDGLIKWIDGVIEDITKRKQAEEQILHDAFHDTLTNLPNRSLFYDRLSHSMARSTRYKDHQYAVLFLDLDRFKLVNDSLGHRMGDQLLIEVGYRLSCFLRSVDTIARLGGDEFAILIDEISGIGEAVTIANRIQKELNLPFKVEGHEVYTTASIGIVFRSDEYEKPEDILRDADMAMYRAKRTGKDRYELFDPKMRQDVLKRMQMETELRRAYERGEFRVYYQPLISIKSDLIIGFEALLRWEHPERGLLLPKDFLKIIEETGLIISIGKWVLQEACKTICDLHAELPDNSPLFVSVNLSRRQFTHPWLISDIQQALENYQIDPSSLVFEITEDVIMDDLEITSSTIQQILDLGAKIQMDDFGTGYSSLAALHRFPIGALKIAREFIVEIESDEERSEVVRIIISLARTMGIHVIAEGVENSHQLDYLKKENCDIWQGFYCSKAIHPDSLVQFMTDSKGRIPVSEMPDKQTVKVGD